MATSSDFLVIQTVADTKALIDQLAQVRQTMARIIQRGRALGLTTADAYTNWPTGYTAQDFKGVINALDSVDMPDSVVADTVRNRLHKLVANIQ